MHFTLRALPVMKNRMGRDHVVLDRHHHNDSRRLRTYGSRVSRARNVRDKNQAVSATLDGSRLARFTDVEEQTARKDNVISNEERRC